MNNREHLNTLSDEEYAEEWLKVEKMLYGDCGFHVEVIVDWLSQPHETTADEDFAEMDFHNIKEGNDMTYFAYEDSEGRQLYISKYGNEYDSMGEMWSDDLVNNIRTIADKKRKEVWG